VIFCQGKIYYELLEKKEELNADNVAIVRIEQLHPLPEEQLSAILKKYEHAKSHYWVQEEPVNMGAWGYLKLNWSAVELHCISRFISGASATGSGVRWAIQQKAIVEQSFLDLGISKATTTSKRKVVANGKANAKPVPKKKSKA